MHRKKYAVAWVLAAACSTIPASRLTANPGPDRTAQVGIPVQFDGSGSTGTITSYTWDFGDSTPTATGMKVSHTYATNGDYNASLTVRGPGGADTKSALVHVGAPCQAQASINVITTSPQPNQVVQFDASASTGCAGSAITDYSWDFGDGNKLDAGATASASHTYATKGTYNIQLTVTDSKGTTGSAARQLDVGITSTGKPIAICPSATSASTGTPTQFTGNGSDPGGANISTFTWTFSDDASTATGQTVAHTFVSAGSFTVTLVVGTSDGRTSDPCTVAVTVTAPVNYSGAWILNPAAGNMTGCSAFGQSFPASCLSVFQDGGWMSATPAGNGWPGGVVLSGPQDGPPAAPGTFRLSATTGATTIGQCTSATPTQSIVLNFTSPSQANGTWQILYSFSCVPAQTCSFSCNCDASQTFTSAPTGSCP